MNGNYGDWPVGSYVVDINYNGDENYSKSTTTTNVTFSPKTSINVTVDKCDDQDRILFLLL
ncbi:hypothetical protein [uncultured Methanobrevibacter sp.]|uniref:hypothetical protein n=1 Tax=uncultured Methanobrevibacter sp. TaxID=253161 RepID=UPI0026348292|nr:hypothetical protein [uncultured Methanobrevibacter sp.]